MSAHARLESLKRRLAQLDAQIVALSGHVGADDLEITVLEKEKLSAKEKMVGIEGAIAGTPAAS